MHTTLAERFWTKVDKRGPDECWEWAARRNYKGSYGEMKIDCKDHIRAHRVSYELNVGAIPAGLNVLHSCDNPPCCNPRHLFLGTQADNMADMHAKGRGRGAAMRGEENRSAKLTAAKVAEIRAAEGKQREIAAKYGVSPATISYIRGGGSWRGVA